MGQVKTVDLTTPHWEAVTAETRDVLTISGQMSLLRLFSLAGGTALAPRLGSHVAFLRLASAAACPLLVSDV